MSFLLHRLWRVYQLCPSPVHLKTEAKTTVEQANFVCIRLREREQTKMWRVQPHIERLKLRLNEDDRFWHILTNDNRWVLPEKFNASSSASVYFDEDGRRATIASEPGYPQRVLIADIDASIVLGVITVSERGSILMTDGQATPVVQAYPWRQSKMVTAILGTYGVFTISVTDVIGKDTDLMRHKKGATRLFLPRVFVQGTARYDDMHGGESTTPSRAITPEPPTPMYNAQSFELRPIAMQSAQQEPMSSTMATFPLNEQMPQLVRRTQVNAAQAAGTEAGEADRQATPGPNEPQPDKISSPQESSPYRPNEPSTSHGHGEPRTGVNQRLDSLRRFESMTSISPSLYSDLREAFEDDSE